jgi:hypothetical protein
MNASWPQSNHSRINRLKHIVRNVIVGVTKPSPPA